MLSKMLKARGQPREICKEKKTYSSVQKDRFLFCVRRLTSLEKDKLSAEALLSILSEKLTKLQHKT